MGRGGTRHRICVLHVHARMGGDDLPGEQKVTEEFGFGHHYVAVEVPSSLTA